MLEDNKSYLKDLNEAQLNAVLKQTAPQWLLLEQAQEKLEY